MGELDMPRKIPKQHTGGWVDESISPRAKKKILGLPHGEELLCQIQRLLGEYRDWSSYRDTAPTKEETLKHSEKTQKLVADLLTHLGMTPEPVKAYISEDLYLTGKGYFEGFVYPIEQQLQTYLLLLKRSQRRVEQWPSNKGRRPSNLEHILLSNVAGLLEGTGMKVTEAAAQAAEILQAAGVSSLPGPDDPKEARKAVRAIRESMRG
ncbi:hypothetical protein [Alcanivorax sediminis]|uniref:Uncharacterized protein n=1 Tax=Alcanivorax sediminis TaxID=2663008 RepID=A0A6N7LU27_9GAMM|nr:hypothetical protein [Alcanivorax sediminis]MQX53927.1 hypothetical protein [Alcanivorax sediminis]